MIFDIVIIVITLMFAIKCYNQGLVKSVILAVSNFITIIASLTIAKRYALEISEKYIYNNFNTYITNIVNENVNLTSILDSLSQKTKEVDSVIVDYLLNMSPSDVDYLIGLSTESALDFLTTNISKSLSYGFSFVIIFIISIIVVTIAFKLLLIFIDFMIKVTLLSLPNKVLGGILGAFVGIFLSCSLVWTTLSVVPLTIMDNGIFSEHNINDTYILKYIIENQPKIFTNFIK